MIGQQSPLKATIGAHGWDPRRRTLGVCLVLAAITFAVFGQTTGYEFVNLDDNVYVYQNATVSGGISLKGIAWVFTHAECDLYHPLTMLSLMADYQLHGFHAGGYHLTNVLLHIASVILLFLILRQMTGAFWRSAFVAAVFAIHPLRVESVAWVAERKDVLGTFFFMLTLGAYVRYVRKANSLARYLMVAGAFMLALLSKPTVVTLPFVLLLLDYWPLNRFEQPRKLSGLILEKVPLLALAAGTCAATVLGAGQEIASNNIISFPARLGNALVSYVIYLRQMVWPEGLSVIYPRTEKGCPIWTIALSILFLAFITGGVLAFQRKRRWLLAGWLWYLGMLTPMIGIVQSGVFAHADRMTYLPQIGIYIAVTWLVAEWRLSRVVFGGIMIGVLAVLMVCAWKQTTYWQDSETLWAHAIACTTGNDMAHNNLGNALYQEGIVDEAITHFQRALEINPDNATAHVNLAAALRRTGKMAEAITHLHSALKIEPANVEVQNDLAWLLATCPEASLRNGAKAVELARQANKLTGGENPIILQTLAAAFGETGRFSEAMETAQRALRLAEGQSNTTLSGELQFEMKLYQAGRPYHTPEKAN